MSSIACTKTAVRDGGGISSPPTAVGWRIPETDYSRKIDRYAGLKLVKGTARTPIREN